MQADRRLAIHVWIDSSLLRSFVADAEAEDPNETGGMLVGYWAVDGGDLVVVDAIPGGPGAQRSRTGFRPDGRWQQARLEQLYSDSERTTTYVGDWHSHPRGTATPSRKDIKTARRVAGLKSGRTPRPLTLIVGRVETRWCAEAYIYDRSRLQHICLRSFEAGHAN